MPLHDKEESSCNEIDGEEAYYVEKIVDVKVKNGVKNYLVKWKGYDEKDNSWEPENGLQCDELIAQFEEERSKSE